MTFDQFVEVCRTLKVDRSGGEPKPYKPLLVATVIVLIHKGEIRGPDIFLDGGVKSVFYQLLRALFPGKFAAAKVAMPYRYLETDGVWRLVAKSGASAALDGARAAGGAEWQVLKHVACARMDPAVFEALATSFRNRFRVLQALIQAHRLPLDRTGYLWDLLNTDEPAAPVPVAADGHLTEKAVEEHLERHWSGTEFARMGIELSTVDAHGLPGRQVLTPRNTIDLLGYRKAGREWWVFELKKGRTSDAVVGQVGRYMGWVTQFHARPREQVRGAIIVGRTDENLRSAVLSNDRLSLWQYDQALEVRRVG